MTDTVLLFIRAGEFVLFDNTLEVIIATGSPHDADLAVRTHNLAVEKECRLRVLFEGALGNQPLEVCLPLRVDFRSVEVCAGREVNFGFADVQKTEGIAGSDLACLVGGHDVVWQLADAGGELWHRSKRGEWFY